MRGTVFRSRNSARGPANQVRQVKGVVLRRRLLMLRVAEISARFAFADGAAVTFGDTLEVSLDCCICHRCRRTVVFKVGGVEGKCTPTGHPFPGKIVGMEASANSVVYRLEYWFEPFDDAKYPERRTAQDGPT